MEWASGGRRLFTQCKRKYWFDSLLTFTYGKLVAEFVEQGGRRRKMFERRNGDGVLAVRLLRMRRVKYFTIGKYNFLSALQKTPPENIPPDGDL